MIIDLELEFLVIAVDQILLDTLNDAFMIG
jgi:hypothetical protein